MEHYEDMPGQRRPGESGAGDPGRAAGARGDRWRVAAWLVLVTGTVALVAGVWTGEGLLIAAGLVLAGVSGHLFTPEYRNGRRGRPPG